MIAAALNDDLSGWLKDMRILLDDAVGGNPAATVELSDRIRYAAEALQCAHDVIETGDDSTRGYRSFSEHLKRVCKGTALRG